MQQETRVSCQAIKSLTMKYTFCPGGRCFIRINQPGTPDNASAPVHTRGNVCKQSPAAPLRVSQRQCPTFSFPLTKPLPPDVPKARVLLRLPTGKRYTPLSAVR